MPFPFNTHSAHAHTWNYHQMTCDEINDGGDDDEMRGK